MALSSTARPIEGAVATLGVSDRVTFLRKTYAHLGVALLAFAALTGGLLKFAPTMSWGFSKWALNGRWNWLAVLALTAGTVTYIRLIDRGREPLRFLRRDWSPAAVAAAVGLGVLGAVGWVANDSSIAVPATMMIVVVPVLVDRVVLPVDQGRAA